ncbi:hypothetical protein PR048_011190 [Dryococelus australis]|uniref:Uncharacterized protein n=1 Tax=Dryococelus australis TaxID=614101 RepID=A0ABQ9HLF8_9NEOP|nr:hypothetical protein PR048_011190 [Dryococelus australis]
MSGMVHSLPLALTSVLRSLATQCNKADIKMNRNTFNEMVDVLQCYGATNLNAHAARKHYAQ